jgi:hypothetical protein
VWGIGRTSISADKSVEQEDNSDEAQKRVERSSGIFSRHGGGEKWRGAVVAPGRKRKMHAERVSDRARRCWLVIVRTPRERKLEVWNECSNCQLY